MAMSARHETRGRNPAAAKNALIEAGARVFGRQGYFSTNSNIIAREAGYAPASFYTYFKDKLGLFLAVYDRWVEDEWTEIRAAGAKQDRFGALKAIVEAVLARHRQTVVFRASLRALDALEPSVREARNRQRVAQLAWLDELVRATGGSSVPLARGVLALFAMERILDAAADGDTAALGVSDDRLISELAMLLDRLLFSKD